MGAVFKKQSTRAVPAGAEIVQKGADRIVTESATYFAKYRDATGKVVVRPTECRDKQAAEQILKKWEREGEQIKSGTLDRKALDAARQSAVPLEEHLTAYERSLVAAEVSDTYRANVLRAVRCVSKDCGFATPADFDREAVENWMAARIEDGMSARSRNYYRESLIAFANWCVGTGRLVNHDLSRVPKADQKSDPRRQRRSLTEDELKRLLAVAAVRPLTDTQMIRRGARRGASRRVEARNRYPASGSGTRAGTDLQDAGPDRVTEERASDTHGRTTRFHGRERVPSVGRGR